MSEANAASRPGNSRINLVVQREDDPVNPGRQVFVLRDEIGAEVARTTPFLPESAPAHNALDRLRETLIARGWEIVQRPNAAFGDDWWAYRFAPGSDAVDPAQLAEILISSGVPALQMPRRRRRTKRDRRARSRRVALPSTSVLVFGCFALAMLTVTIGFIIIVLMVLAT